MATVAEIYRGLDQKAPFALQMTFDNAGFLVGRGEMPVTKILVALDITQSVMQEAVAIGANLIVAHHPVIWDRCAAVTDQTLTGKKLLFLIEHKIAAICAHTNLDAVEGGVNTVLANRFQLENISPLHTDGCDQNGTPYGIGRVGNLKEPVAFFDFIQTVKKTLQISAVRVADHGKPVHRLAVGGGACGGMLQDALALGCDTFLTSELKHDVYLDAQMLGINLIDAGHYTTEAVICSVLRDWLSKFGEVKIASKQQEVFQTI